MNHIVRIRKRRLEEDGKMTEFSHCKRAVPAAKIDRFAQRTGVEARMMMSGSSMIGLTPPAIDYKTPSECNSEAGTPAAPKGDEELNSPSPGCQLEGMATLNLDVMQDLATSPRNNLSNLNLSPRLQISADDVIASDIQEMPARVSLSVDISRVSTTNQPDGVSIQFEEMLEEHEAEEQYGYQTELSDGSQDLTVEMLGFGRQLTLNEPRSEQVVPPEIRECQPGGNDGDLLFVTKEIFEHSVMKIVDHALSQPCNRAKLGGHLRAAASRGDRQTVQRILHISKEVVDDCTVYDFGLGRAALHNAASAGYYDIVKDLLEAGADPYVWWLDDEQATEFKCMSTLDLAVQSGDVNIMELLVSSPCTVSGDKLAEQFMANAVKFAMHKEYLACLEILVKCVCRNRNFLWDGIVRYAISKFHFEGLRALVRHGINIIPASSRSILSPHFDVSDPLAWSMIEFLVHTGMDLNSKNDLGHTLLHWTIYWGSPSFNCEDPLEFAQRLLMSGADPNAKNKLGMTPLHAACSNYEYSNKEFVKLLLGYGADPNIRDLTGRTPLHFAALTRTDGHMATLIQAGAALEILGCKGGQAQNYAIIHSFVPGLREVEQGGPHPPPWPNDFLFRSGLMTDTRDNQGNGVLHYVAVYPCLRRLLPHLLRAGIDPNVQNLLGETPLHKILKFSPRLHDVEVLLNNGARLDMRNSRDETAVHVAISHWTTVSLVYSRCFWRNNLLRFLSNGKTGHRSVSRSNMQHHSLSLGIRRPWSCSHCFVGSDVR